MMKLSYLKTHWTPEEAKTVLIFLEELQQIISNAYGNEIDNFYQNEIIEKQMDESDHDFTIEDDAIPF